MRLLKSERSAGHTHHFRIVPCYGETEMRDENFTGVSQGTAILCTKRRGRIDPVYTASSFFFFVSDFFLSFSSL